MDNLDIVIGKYVLRKKIGDGGMAEVFLGESRGEGAFTRPVAVKKILPHLASNEKFRRNFINEAMICAKLHHHNLVEVYDFIEDGNDLYLVMEYIHGLDLETVLDLLRRLEETLPTGVIVSIMIQALEGLEYAHKEVDRQTKQPLNVVHRDLKPSNLLLDANGVVKIVDFGVAKAANRKYETQEMTAKGTASYMAPEQLMGDRAPMPSLDIFSMGTIFYEMLTMNRLFDGEHVFAILKQVATMDVEKQLDQAIRGADRRFVSVLKRALAREPEDRYRDAAEMLKDVMALHVREADSRAVADLLRKVQNLAENPEEAATRLVRTADLRKDHEDDLEQEDQETQYIPPVESRPAGDKTAPGVATIVGGPRGTAARPAAPLPEKPAPAPAVTGLTEVPVEKGPRVTGADTRGGGSAGTLSRSGVSHAPRSESGVRPVPPIHTPNFRPIQEPTASVWASLAIGAGIGAVILVVLIILFRW